MNSSSKSPTASRNSLMVTSWARFVWISCLAVALLLGFNVPAGLAQKLEPTKSSNGLAPKQKRTTGDPYFTPSKHQSKTQTSTNDDAFAKQFNSNKESSIVQTDGLTPIVTNGKLQPTRKNDNASIIRQPVTNSAGRTDTRQSSRGPTTKSHPKALASANGNNVAGWGKIDPQETTIESEPVKQANKIGNQAADSQVNKASYKSFEPGKVLAIVGGEPIFYGDLLFKANQLIESRMSTAPETLKAQQRPKLVQMLLAPTIEAEMLYIDAIQGLPDGADVDNILEQAGKEFDEKALPVILEKSKINSPSLYDAHLRSMGHSLRKMRKDWSKEQLTKYFLGERLNVSEDVSHTELLAYYKEHPEEFEVPARVRWEQVMVRFDNYKTRADAKKAIVKLGNQIVYGANLQAVAKRESNGPRASKGGQHDWTKRGDLAYRNIEKLLFELPIGDLSEIVESLDGYHVLRVIEREEQSSRPFFDVQIEIKKKLLDEKRGEAFKKHVESIRERIPVEIFDDVFAEESKGDGPTAIPN